MFSHSKYLTVKENQDIGQVVYVGPARDFTPVAMSITPGPEGIMEHVLDDGESFADCSEKAPARWIRLCGLHDIELVQRVGHGLEIPDIVLEDIVDTSQRPKFEEFENGFYMVLKIIDYDDSSHRLMVEQVSLVLTGNTLVTFQENLQNDWDGLLARLRKGRHKNKTDPHYFLLSLFDLLVDRYMTTIGKLGDRVEELEGQLMEIQSEKTLYAIYGLKRETALLRKHLWPLREVLQHLSHKRKSKHVSDYTRAYIDEVFGHAIQAIEMVDTLDQLTSNLLDVYSSVSDMRMNRVMKILTVVGTVFMPLTFITGVYGMNFENMPELNWRYGYYVVLGICLLLVSSMLAWFRHKRWL